MRARGWIAVGREAAYGTVGREAANATVGREAAYGTVGREAAYATVRCAIAAVAAACVGAGCANVLGIPDEQPSFCASHGGHAYCEDFDVGAPASRWTFSAQMGGTLQIEPSDDSPPSLLDLSAPPLLVGSALAGFDREFDAPGFPGLHIEADMRFVTPRGGPLAGSGGVLLVVDKLGGCIGIGVTPMGFGAVVLPSAEGCSALTSGAAEAGVRGGDAGTGPVGMPITGLPPTNTWFHVTVVVAPDTTKNDGSGTLTLNVRGDPTPSRPISIPPGTLAPQGAPLVGFAAETNAPSGALEVQVDNITIDLAAR